MSILFYKRPDYIARENGPLSRSNCQKYVERAACSRAQIPPELSFENVMEGKTMPPCSIPDFLDYLIYVAHDAENLQFFLWLRDYTKRFNNLAPAQKRLSPKWLADEAPPDLTSTKKSYIHVGQLLKSNADNMDSFNYYRNGKSNVPYANLTKSEQERFQQQPFRKEISEITAHYILPSSPRELNLSHKDRSSLLTALSQTTHPSAFAPVLELTTMMLRNHSHPNFVRWSLCNGNKPRVLFLRSFAVWWISIACLMSLLLILSHQPRWARICIAPVLWFGTVNLVAASRGLCVLLHRMHTREVHPWEMDSSMSSSDEKVGLGSLRGPNAKGNARNRSEDDSKPLTLHLKPPQVAGPNSNYLQQADNGGGRAATPSPFDNEYPNPNPNSNSNSKDSTMSKSGFDSDVEALSVLSGSTTYKSSPFGPSNAYEHEPWVERWRRTGWVRKLSLRKVWVKEEGLRILQNRIVRQAELIGVLVTVPVTVGVVACPVVGLY